MTDELEKYAAQLEASGHYRVLRRFECPGVYWEEDGSELRRGVFLDVETTGTDPSKDEIIELAMVPFEYCAAGRVYRVGSGFSGLRDPGKPLPPFVSELTGLKDEDLRGKRIDPSQVAEFLDGVSLVVAHNAAFDRPFFERAFPGSSGLPWACSQREVPWHAFGVEGRKLEYIAYRAGVYFDGHRAEVDCQVGVHVLAQDWAGDGSTALSRLLESCERVDARLWALESPFDLKDHLKARGYRFDGPRKTWYRDLDAQAIEAEKAWLARNIYADLLRRRGKVKLSATYVTARERYGPALEPVEEIWLS